MCSKHKDKLIEYFCKDCLQPVCSKCMFENHNGHHLVTMEECNTMLTEELDSLGKRLHVVKSNNGKQMRIVEELQNEIEIRRKKQQSNINDGFDQIMLRLQEKRAVLLTRFDS